MRKLLNHLTDVSFSFALIKQDYRAVSLPHLGQSDHLSLLLIPAYTPIRKQTPASIRVTKTWPDDSPLQLQAATQPY